MEFTHLGRTALRVSRLCMGTMNFGMQCDEATSFAILDAAVEAGINFIDTADVYPPTGGRDWGVTETIIGRWLAARPGRREHLIIATKFGLPMGDRPWQQGGSRRHVMDAVDGSLRRLGVAVVDLYQIHTYDPTVSHDETLGALDDLVKSGKVRYIGCSNYLAYRLARSIGRSETLGLARYDCVQPRYNLLYRNAERELLPLCEEEGIGVIPFNPLAGGFLSGKHRADAPPPEGRFTIGAAGPLHRERYWHEREFATVESLRPVAAEAGMSLTQLAVAWTLAHPAVTAPIIGASRPEQLRDALAAIDTPLNPELKLLLDELTVEYMNHPAVR